MKKGLYLCYKASEATELLRLGFNVEDVAINTRNNSTLVYYFEKTDELLEAITLIRNK